MAHSLRLYNRKFMRADSFRQGVKRIVKKDYHTCMECGRYERQLCLGLCGRCYARYRYWTIPEYRERELQRSAEQRKKKVMKRSDLSLRNDWLTLAFKKLIGGAINIRLIP